MNEIETELRQLLEAAVASGIEQTIQLAVWFDGEWIVDLTVGPGDAKSLCCSWSVTKAFSATAVHLLVDRGLLCEDSRLGDCWPEFAAHGKQDITVAQVLTHTAGIPQMPNDVSPTMICDWERMCAAIAEMRPLWRPGDVTAYHFWTFGWLVGELVRRTDGRDLPQFIRAELCMPLGIDDFFLRIARAEEDRVIPLVAAEPAITGDFDADFERAAPRAITSVEVMNRDDVRRACLPACGGIMNARAIATLFAMLANGGELAGRRVLSRERVAALRELRNDAHDRVLGKRYRRGLGFFLGGRAGDGGDPRIGDRGREFGHPGYSRALGFADPERRLAFGLTKNVVNPEVSRADSVAQRAADLVRHRIDRRFRPVSE